MRDDDFNPLSLSFRLDEGRPMAPQDNRDPDAYQTIGWLKGQLEALKEAVEANGVEASKGRERMYVEIAATKSGVADIKSQVTGVSEQMADLSDRVKKTEEKLTTYNNWSQQLKGSWRTIAFFSAAIAAGITYFGKYVMAKFAG